MSYHFPGWHPIGGRPAPNPLELVYRPVKVPCEWCDHPATFAVYLPVTIGEDGEPVTALHQACLVCENVQPSPRLPIGLRNELHRLEAQAVDR